DALHQVVDRRGELIRPVALAIADEQVAALIGWALLLRTVPQIVEALDAWLQPHADPAAGRVGQAAIAAGAGGTNLRASLRDSRSGVVSPKLACRSGERRRNGLLGIRDLGPRARARVDQARGAQPRDRCVVDRAAFALAHHRRVGAEPEPRKIVE